MFWTTGLNATAQTSLTVSGVPNFQPANPAAGIPNGTELTAPFFSDVQGELLNVVFATGQTPTENTPNQLLTGLQIIGSGVVGAMRNAQMNVPVASASAAFSADEIVLETALGGLPFRVSNFNEAVNLTTVGAGGMDTGAAPDNGYLAIYAIYNPSARAAALLAQNTTLVIAPNVYGGANMPAGYTASALVSVWPTNASGQFITGNQQDRKIKIPSVEVLTTSTPVAITALSISSAVPLNAKTVYGSTEIASTSSGSLTFQLFSSTYTGAAFEGTAGTSSFNSFSDFMIATPQTIYYLANVTAGTMSASLFINGYTF